MILTDIDIKDALYSYIKDSDLVKSMINGNLYKDKRPLNSDKEDLVLSVLARNSGDVQTFVINANLFVKDKKRGDEFIEDTQRLRELSRECSSLFKSNVFGRLNLTIESQSIYEVAEVDCHCINNRLNVRAFVQDYREL